MVASITRALRRRRSPDRTSPSTPAVARQSDVPPPPGRALELVGAPDSEVVRSQGRPVAASPHTRDWGSGSMGAGQSRDVRPRGPSVAPSPPSGGWGADTHGDRQSKDVRPRGPSVAPSPPSGGWGAGTNGADPSRDVGSTEPRTYRTRSLRGPRGAVRRPPVFISPWDGRPRGSKNQRTRRPNGVINHRAPWTTTGRHAQERNQSTPLASGVGEVSPWMN